MKQTAIIFLFLLIYAAYPCAVRAQIDFSAQDRVLILSPHPDDEIIACAGIIQKALENNSKLKIVYLTSGEYNEISYFFYKKNLAISKRGFINIGKTRIAEALKATASLGVKKEDLIFLGYPDRFTEAILTSFWDKNKPAVSMLTRISRVPYANAQSYGAPYIGESILSDLKQVLSDFKPTKIFVSSAFDANPDHRSFYVFTAIALLDLKEKIGTPDVYTYLIHKAGWPKAKKYLPSFELNPPDDFIDCGIAWDRVYLTEEEIIGKRKAMALYKSQLSFAGNYLLSFIRKNELFCSCPQVNPVRELRPLTGRCADGGIKPPSASRYTPPTSSVAFSNGVNCGQGRPLKKLPVNSKLISKVSYSKDSESESLSINIFTNRNIAKGLKADIYLLGYSSLKDFHLMPKIFFKAKDNTVIAYNRRKRISAEGIKINAKENLVLITVPLKILDNPDYIFSRIILKGEILALYAGGWQVINLR